MQLSRTVFLLFLLFFSFGLAVNATSWVKLKPEEVVSRAEIVVVGKYDFSSEPINGEPPFTHGYDFIVQKVYKDSTIASPLKVGIDMFDYGWVKEFQQQGGTFLLFLEDDPIGFMTPVGGPNGMIQLKNGKIHIEEQERRTFFESYVKEQEKAISKKGITGTPGWQRYLMPVIYIVLSGVIIFIVIKTIRAK
ncbi:hypothetical protein [Bacillus sp. FJAT-27445]|uniref:hypothetical protein n=1 Tax=Bacillus sp. FJAT-27445 TaxID=1679166 RepID=UPI000743F86B|nr:hypothetical protein [Bacillus sp. FJAT-27445]